ncbi:MAG: ribonuclease Z [Motilibacteraceae bacterium]
MAARELVVLGTASQVPTRTRNHNGYVLRLDDQLVLLDPGEGTQRQLTLAGVAAVRLTRICLTHAHGDHCFGLPGVLARIALDSRQEGAPAHEVPLHFPAPAQAQVDALRFAAGGGDGDATDRVVERPVRGDGLLADGPWRVVTRELDHRVPAVGYRFEEPDGLRLLPTELAARGISGPAVRELTDAGRLEVGGRWVALAEVSEPRPGQVVAHVMDTRPCDGALALAERADLLVIEATYLHRDRALAEQYGHLTARQAAQIARDAGVRRLVLTHFSQRYGDDEEFERAYLEEARAVHPDVVLARDLDRIALPPRR